MDPLPRSGDLMQVRNHAAERSMAYYEEFSYEKQVAATITWSLGGKQVAVTGSWDNWESVYGICCDFSFSLDLTL